MKQTQWQLHVEAFNKSGLSKREYVETHQLIYHQFLYWSQKLNKAAPEAFVPVTVTPPCMQFLQEQKTGLSFYRRNGLCRRGRLGVHSGRRSGRRVLIPKTPGFFRLLALGCLWGLFFVGGIVFEFGGLV